MEIGATARHRRRSGGRTFGGIATERNFEVRQGGKKLGDAEVDAKPYVRLRALLIF